MRRTALVFALAALLAVPAASATAVAVDRASGTEHPTVAGPAGHSTVAAGNATGPCVGTIREYPDRTTLFSIQGAHEGEKTTNMVVGVLPDGSVVGVHDDRAAGRWWTYDIDRLPDGDILTATTISRHTLIEEIDPETGEHVSERHFRDVKDAHDVDLINGDELLMNDKPSGGDDRVLVYNLTREEVVWEYSFANHTDVWPKDGGDGFENDWTHNNDVERIGDGVFMVSVRNFDQVAAINRSTKDVEWILGEDDNASVLLRQHNPDYIETDDGSFAVLVADSRNDRVVEYTREDGEWNRTWVLRGGLDEPRDADRLPNGNTLVADRHSHRILEVTPDGEVVWEVYAPYQPYDVERLGTGDESSGPAMVDANATGVAEVRGSARPTEAAMADCYDSLTSTDSTRLVPEEPPTDTGPNATDSEDTPADDALLGTAADASGGLGPGFGPLVAVGALFVAALVALAVRRRG